MPWKSDKQRRWAHATGQPWAKDWDNKYNQGGSVMGLLDKRDQDMKITVKKPNGSSVTYHSPEGSQVDMVGILGGMVDGPDMGPTADNVTARLTPGEFVVNRPAAQKYMGLLEGINNEGKQMLAMGGYTKPMMGYANGGIVDNPLYDMLQEDYDYLQEMVSQGVPIEQIVEHYVSTWQLQGTPEERSIIRSVAADVAPIGSTQFPFTPENPNQGFGYATDDTPIVSQGNPREWALRWVQTNGVEPTSHNIGILEMLAKEAIADYGRLPQHERDEWGSELELAMYYMDEFAVEEGVTRGYAEGGMVTPNASGAAAAFADEFGIEFTDHNLEKADRIIREMIDEGAHTGLIAGALAEEFGIDATDHNLQRLEQAVIEFIGGNAAETPGYYAGGEVSNHDKLVRIRRWLEDDTLSERDREILIDRLLRGYWSGGEVGKGTPDEGDTANHLGGGFQGIVFRNGQWVYARSGNPVPDHVVAKINAYANEVAAEDAQVSAGTGVAGGAEATVATEADAAGSESDAGLGLNATESKEAGWARRAIQAEKVIRELFAAGFNPSSVEYAKGEGFAGWVGDLARTPEGQRFHSAAKQFSEAALRKDTGAAIAADEFERTYSSNFGGFGTGAASQVDRGAHREQIIQGYIDASGAAAPELMKEFEVAKNAGPSAPSAEDAAVFTEEDLGGIAGGILGGVAGGIFGGPLVAALGAGAGTYLGRAIAQWFTTDDGWIEALTPEASDAIDTVLSTATGGVGKAGSVAYKAAKAAIAKRAAKEGTTTLDELGRIADDYAKGGVGKAVSGTAGRAAAQVSGRVPAAVAEKAAAGGFGAEVAFHGKPFLVNPNTRKVMDGLTGSITRGKTAKDVLKRFDETIGSTVKFAMGGKVSNGLLGL